MIIKSAGRSKHKPSLEEYLELKCTRIPIDKISSTKFTVGYFKTNTGARFHENRQKETKHKAEICGTEISTLRK